MWGVYSPHPSHPERGFPVIWSRSKQPCPGTKDCDKIQKIHRFVIKLRKIHRFADHLGRGPNNRVPVHRISRGRTPLHPLDPSGLFGPGPNNEGGHAKKPRFLMILSQKCDKLTENTPF